MKNSVLLIENDAAIADIVDYILTEAGYNVVQTPAYRYIEAVKNLNPGLILLDYSLSGDITGASICSNIKANKATADIPVIIVSAVVGLEEIAKDCQADDILTKPFDIADLETVVTKWFNNDRIAS
ncbi:response regulator [Mucilaginibacter sp. JRF]|uniref:response regulator n=1 Tax=Mucilaginibacter sp. JRF TaxID=2780088 RepID=UPI0018825979|nr:response regulator [Mucilaginibacter sp. JRF]MBE9582976.1 response regulator [Mucilaginibacter sp. JRF]